MVLHQFLMLLIAGVFVSTVSSENSIDSIKPKCESNASSVILPDPEDCGKYFVCDRGNLISFDCPRGYRFSPLILVCIP